jgi:hypothetical protein
MTNLCQFLDVSNMSSVKSPDKTQQIVHLSRLGKATNGPLQKLLSGNVTSSGQSFSRCIFVLEICKFEGIWNCSGLCWVIFMDQNSFEWALQCGILSTRVGKWSASGLYDDSQWTSAPRREIPLCRYRYRDRDREDPCNWKMLAKSATFVRFLQMFCFSLNQTPEIKYVKCATTWVLCQILFSTYPVLDPGNDRAESVREKAIMTQYMNK